MSQIETEYKLEVNESEFEAGKRYLIESGYLEKGTSRLEDYFFNVTKFDDKGWNFLRIRVYDGERYERTEKIWKHNSAGERVREEIERPSDKKELETLESTSTPLRLSKERADYSGTVLDRPAVYSFDKVVFPDETRFFVECEIRTTEEESHRIRADLKALMLQTLHLSDRPEGIGMMRLVLSKAEKNSN